MKDKIVFKKKDHSYYKNGVRYDSVSSIIEKYFSKFDIDKIAKFKAYKSKKEGIKGQGVRYWKALWKKNREYGSDVHKDIQDVLSFKDDPQYDETIHAIRYLHNFERKISDPLTMSEVILFNDEYKIAGTADILVYDNLNNTMYIIDWKVVNEIRTEGYQGKKSKLGTPDSNYWKYCVQLNLYAWMLRQNGYNTIIVGIAQLTPQELILHKVPGMIEEINKILEDRK